MFYKFSRTSFLTLIFMLVLVSMPIFAADEVGKHATADINNIGFMQNPPKELKEKFPMCDAFLKVEWIDKEKKVGYSKYEFYNQGVKVKLVAHALIYLDDDHPVFDGNLDEFRKKGKLKDTFELIELGEFEPQDPGFGLVLDAERNGINYQYKFNDIRSDWQMPLLTLADNKLNVCIPYPDNQRMYFAELKKVGKVYSNNEIEKKKANLERWVAKPFDFFEKVTLFDVNFDGRVDYFTEISLIYSHDGNYYQIVIAGAKRGPEMKLTSPTNGKDCEYQNLWGGNYYLTTDGGNIFLYNQCNLTELTK